MAADPYSTDGTARPQVQDQWGRSPDDPEYGKPPGAAGTIVPPSPDNAYGPYQPHMPRIVSPEEMYGSTGLQSPGNGGPSPYGPAGTSPFNTLTPNDPYRSFPGSQPGTINSSGPPLSPGSNLAGPAASPGQPSASPNYGTGFSGNPTDRNAVSDWVHAQFASGRFPASLLAENNNGGENYYVTRILENGGLQGQYGPDYWGNRLSQTTEQYNAGLGNRGGSAGFQGMMAQPQVESAVYSAPTYASQAVSNIGNTSSQGADLYNLLLQRMTQSPTPNANDPIIRNQVDAYDAQQQNQQRNYLQALAERQGPMANISAETRAANEKVGQNTAGFQAELMARELTAQRQEIQNALTQGQAWLTDQEKLAKQTELANIDAAIRYAQLNQQESQFGRSLGQNAWQFDAALQNQILGG